MTTNKLKRTPPLPIDVIGKMIKINGIVKPVYKYESSNEDIFNPKGKTTRILKTILKKETYCFVLKHKIIQLGEYIKGNYESRGMFGDEDCSQPYLKVTHTEKVYLCTTSITCNKPMFFVHPNNIIETEDDN